MCMLLFMSLPPPMISPFPSFPLNEVAQHLHAVGTLDGLRMELHADHLQLFMLHTHHHPFFRPRGDFEARRYLERSERVIPGDFGVIGYPFIEGGAIMLDWRGLAMHYFIAVA